MYETYGGLCNNYIRPYLMPHEKHYCRRYMIKDADRKHRAVLSTDAIGSLLLSFAAKLAYFGLKSCPQANVFFLFYASTQFGCH